MPGILNTLVTSANALRVFERSLATTQSNVANASTPGYVKQRLLPEPLPMDLPMGLLGGITAGEIQSSRDVYAEQVVRRQASSWGRYSQSAADLAQLEPLFDITGQAGIPGAVNALFNSFSAWSVAPNDATARRTILDRAQDVAQRFGETTGALGQASTALNGEIRSAVDSINRLAGIIGELNTEIRTEARNAADPALDARMHSAIEELSEYVDVTVLRQADGSVTLLAGGQAPLVIGERVYELAAEMPDAAVIRDSLGHDVTGLITTGRLGAMLETKNTTIPGLLASLDDLAEGLAGGINAALAGGVDQDGNPGASLFSFDAAAGAARTLRVALDDPRKLAAALPGAEGGNGNALALAALAGAPVVDSYTANEFYAGIAARLGQSVEASRENEQVQNDLLVQARALREQTSGVSLDEEAVRLIEFQRAYQAVAQIVHVLDQLSETVITMMR